MDYYFDVGADDYCDWEVIVVRRGGGGGMWRPVKIIFLYFFGIF